LAEIEKIETFFKSADIYAMPSLIEGLPLVALEAMACGLPIVSSLSAAGGDLIVDGENGLLVPAGDVSSLVRALQALLIDSDLRIRMGKASQEIAKSYDRVAVAKEHIKLYEKLCKTSLGDEQ